MKASSPLVRSPITGVLAFLITTCGLLADPASDGALWKDKIEKASPGSQLLLPAGRFEMADIKVPEGVKLSGAGYLQTILDCAKGTDGIVAAKGCEIRGLTGRQSPGAGLLFKETPPL